MERWFTPQERGVILFLVAALLVGAAIYIYKLKNPYFAPELKILESGKWTELEEYEAKDSLKQLIQETKANLTQQTSQTGREKFLAEGKVGVGGEGVSAKININTASEKELITLPGIGPVIAQRIIEYRENRGSFKKIEDIMKVKGIGKKKFEKLKDKLTI